MTDKHQTTSIQVDGAVPDNEARLQIGPVVCGFSFLRLEDCRDFKENYHDFLTGEPADVTVRLETVKQFDPAALDQMMKTTTYTHQDNRFWTSSGVAFGNYNLSRGIISIVVERKLAELTGQSNYLNKLLKLVYYSACRAKFGDRPFPAMMIEGCSIMRHGRAIIFTGPLTQIALSGFLQVEGADIINDETVLLSRYDNGNGITLENVPIANSAPLKRSGVLPAGAIFFLKPGERSFIRKLEAAEACIKLIRQITNPAYIGQTSKREIYTVMADFSADVAERLPMYEIECAADQQGWNEIITTIDSIVLEKEMAL